MWAAPLFIILTLLLFMVTMLSPIIVYVKRGRKSWFQEACKMYALLGIVWMAYILVGITTF